MQTKVILLTETISPYRIPVFNEIAKRLGERFLVLFLGMTEKRRQWRIYKEKIKFRYEVLMHFLLQKRESEPYFLNPTILYKLIKYSPSVIIISGYYNFSSLLAMFYTKFFGRRIILWCEGNKYERRINHPLLEVYKRWFVRNCTEYIVPGKASFEYLISLGAKAEKIWIAPNAVDNDYFCQASDKYRQNKEIFKQSKGYPEKIILYVGRLVDRKGIFDLLKAFQILSREQSDLGLLLIGSGEGQKRYKNFCKTNNIKNVFFVGFVHQEELPAYYAASDVFVLPTHSDPWGLVLNEAMACKLPVISSNVAGATYDLIINGENGYVFQKGDIHQLTAYLKNILSDEQKRIKMGQMSLDIIKNYSPQKCAEGPLRAIKEIGGFNIKNQNRQENVILDYNLDYNLEDYRNFWRGPAKEFLHRMECRILDKMLSVRSGWFIDVGCGYGRLFPLYMRPNRKIVMVDYAINPLEIAAATYGHENIYYVAANVYSLPFHNHSFEAGISIRTFHHMKYPQIFLNEFSRVMRPDTDVVLEYSNKRSLLRLFKYGVRCFYHDHEEYSDLLFGTHPAYFADICKKAGFRVLNNYGTGFFDRLLDRLPIFVLPVTSVEIIFDLLFGPITLAPLNFAKLQKTTGIYEPVQYEKLVDILMCPACQGSIIDAGKEGIECQNCKKLFPKKNSIIDLRYHKRINNG